MEMVRHNGRRPCYELPISGREPWCNFFDPSDPLQEEAARILTTLEVPAPARYTVERYPMERGSALVVTGKHSGRSLDISTPRETRREECHQWSKSERESYRRHKQERN